MNIGMTIVNTGSCHGFSCIKQTTAGYKQTADQQRDAFISRLGEIDTALEQNIKSKIQSKVDIYA